jgi:cytochrome c-type biogenesis protein CcsB
MKKIYSIFSSTITMAVLLAIFAISIATATFIENDFGSAAARNLVYHSKWFELLLFIGMINLIAVIFKRKVYRKPSIFLFHTSFVLIILGAGITRYFGFEGSMHIREGDSSDIVATNNAYITLQASLGENYGEIITPVNLSLLSKNDFSKRINLGNKQLRIKLLTYYPSAYPDIEADPAGIPIAEFMFEDMNPVFLKYGEILHRGGLTISFDTTLYDKSTVVLKTLDNELYYKAPVDVSLTNMMDLSVLMNARDTFHRMVPRMVYHFNDQIAVLSRFIFSARITARPAKSINGSSAPEALLFGLHSGNENKEIWYWGRKDEYGEAFLTVVDDIIVNIWYGVKKVQLPYQIKLNDFILLRYPGSRSPSWFESNVSIIDGSDNAEPDHRIYMNHILKHKGYRFYQSSYDKDEKGTVLAVNYDSAGTTVTYTGYLLMALGMMLSLFNRRSRFKALMKESLRIRQSKRNFIMVALLMLTVVSMVKGNQNEIPVIDPEHARLFGSILVQDRDGRVKPVNTMTSEILRKLTRQNKYHEMSPDQVYISILAFPETWQNIPLIKVGHKQINEILGTQGKLVPFSAFFSGEENYYRLSAYVEQANAKKPAYRSKFDNELIRTDERINVYYMIYSGIMLNIFPKPDDPEQKWYPPIGIKSEFNSKDSAFIKNIIPYYIVRVREALSTNDWSGANEVVSAIKTYQKKYGGKVFPSTAQIKLELLYNRLNLFEHLSSWYGLIGFILLMLQFAGIFYIKLNLRIPVRIAGMLIVSGFVLHTLALAGRWYISGHAPWSNGYEALTYIAWVSVLAGIIFSAKSPVTLSTTAILASIILQTAHLSWMDPEITTLVPVLQSYWLIIHVAVITASYGFLGLGALLAAVNLIIMFLESKSRKKRIDLTIAELSNIIEMTLIAGLYLLAIGTFLGGVWANESWGRYWGWDPKETWALVTIIVYAFIAHMRIIPGLKSSFGFNLAALLGFGSVIMTYFGVNYYLSGLHSYAKGDPLPIPVFVYYLIASVAILALLAYINQYRLKRLKLDQRA